MQKTIYIFLTTLFFSSSAFAGVFDEYGYNNSSYGSPMYNTGAMGGGTYWSQLATDFYTQSNAINPYSYSQTIETKVKTSESYIISSTKPADSPNTIVVKYVSPSTGWDMWKIYPAVTITSTREQTVNIAQANTTVLTSYGPNTYFNFNVYNPAQQSYAYNTYQATPNGAVLVGSAVQSGPPPTSVPFTAIPRSGSIGVLDTRPGSKFQTAIRLYNQQTLTLPEAYKVIVDYIDRVIPDATNGRVLFMQNVISKVAAGLPSSQSGQASTLLINYCNNSPPGTVKAVLVEFLEADVLNQLNVLDISNSVRPRLYKSNNGTIDYSSDIAYPLTINAYGGTKITMYEQLSLTVYDIDSNTKANTTIGFGHLIHEGSIKPSEVNLKITFNEAVEYLKNDLISTDKVISQKIENAGLGGTLTRNQYYALFDMQYNAGAYVKEVIDALKISTQAASDKLYQNVLDFPRGEQIRRYFEYICFTESRLLTPDEARTELAQKGLLK